MARGRKPKVKDIAGVYEQVGKKGSTWTARYWYEGKDVRRTFKTQALASAHLDKVDLMRVNGERLPSSAKVPLLTSVEQEKRGTVSTLLLTDLIDQYMQKQQQTADRESVLNANKTGYMQDAKMRLANLTSRFKKIKAAFHGRYADSIETHEVKDFLEGLNRSNATMNRYKTTLSGVYEFAIERKLLKQNPTSEVQHYTAPLGVPRWMNESEEDSIKGVIRRWIDDTPDDQPVRKLLLREHLNEITFASRTGIRKGNQYALRWAEDINLDLRLIILPNTKTGKPHIVPMTDLVYAALLDQRAIQTELATHRANGDLSEEDREHMKLDGRVFTIRENREWFASAKKEAGITSLRWHDLSRHTAGSRLAAGGASQKVIQEVLGHSTLAMSARYTHLTQTHVAQIMRDALG